MAQMQDSSSHFNDHMYSTVRFQKPYLHTRVAPDIWVSGDDACWWPQLTDERASLLVKKYHPRTDIFKKYKCEVLAKGLPYDAACKKKKKDMDFLKNNDQVKNHDHLESTDPEMQGRGHRKSKPSLKLQEQHNSSSDNEHVMQPVPPKKSKSNPVCIMTDKMANSLLKLKQNMMVKPSEGTGKSIKKKNNKNENTSSNEKEISNKNKTSSNDSESVRSKSKDAQVRNIAKTSDKRKQSELKSPFNNTISTPNNNNHEVSKESGSSELNMMFEQMERPQRNMDTDFAMKRHMYGPREGDFFRSYNGRDQTRYHFPPNSPRRSLSRGSMGNVYGFGSKHPLLNTPTKHDNYTYDDYILGPKPTRSSYLLSPSISENTSTRANSTLSTDFVRTIKIFEQPKNGSVFGIGGALMNSGEFQEAMVLGVSECIAQGRKPAHCPGCTCESGPSVPENVAIRTKKKPDFSPKWSLGNSLPLKDLDTLELYKKKLQNDQHSAEMSQYCQDYLAMNGGKKKPAGDLTRMLLVSLLTNRLAGKMCYAGGNRQKYTFNTHPFHDIVLEAVLGHKKNASAEEVKSAMKLWIQKWKNRKLEPKSPEAKDGDKRDGALSTDNNAGDETDHESDQGGGEEKQGEESSDDDEEEESSNDEREEESRMDENEEGKSSDENGKNSSDADSETSD